MSELIANSTINIEHNCICEVVSQESFPVLVTEAAKNRIIELATKESLRRVLRIEVSLGGCSGKQYIFDMVALNGDIDRADDIMYVDATPLIVVDRASLKEMSGATLSYVSSFQWSGFAITDNPNASSPCSCGSSFA